MRPSHIINGLPIFTNKYDDFIDQRSVSLDAFADEVF